MRALSIPLGVMAAALIVAPSARAQDAPPPTTVDLSDLPLLGEKDGLFYLRDSRDLIRFYPHGELDLDARGSFGSGVDTLSSDEAGVDLGSKMYVRRARLDLSGEIFARLGFDVGIDLAPSPVIDGAASRDDRREVALADAWVNVDAGRGLQIMLGVFQEPFSLENRTRTSDLSMMERNVAIRGFVVPDGKAIGGSFSGSTQHALFRWDGGVFGAESVVPGEYERHFDYMGRLTFRPLAYEPKSCLHDLQFGVSGRYGHRVPRDVVDDSSAINTGQGFTLWRPTRIDSFGRLIHVIDSGDQAALGGELRAPLGPVVITSEAYWVSRNTREAVDGYQSTNTERFGRMSGVGWYAEAALWAFQAFNLIQSKPPEPGTYPHAEHLELARIAGAPERYGLELAAILAGINATYDGSLRNGDPDPSVSATRLEIYQVGGAINYWHTNHFRLSFDVNAYLTPGSGASSLAVVPGNLGKAPDLGAHTLTEVGGRTTVMF